MATVKGGTVGWNPSCRNGRQVAKGSMKFRRALYLNWLREYGTFLTQGGVGPGFR